MLLFLTDMLITTPQLSFYYITITDNIQYIIYAHILIRADLYTYFFMFHDLIRKNLLHMPFRILIFSLTEWEAEGQAEFFVEFSCNAKRFGLRSSFVFIMQTVKELVQ